jgi:hypothetical protein
VPDGALEGAEFAGLSLVGLPPVFFPPWPEPGPNALEELEPVLPEPPPEGVEFPPSVWLKSGVETKANPKNAIPRKVCSFIFMFLSKDQCMGFGDVPLPGVTPLGGVLFVPPCPEPGVGPEGAMLGGTTPGWGDEPVPG